MSIITTDYGLIKPPPGCQLDYGHPINMGLVGCWLFNEKSGTRLTDYSGYNNHTALTNMIPQSWTGSNLGGGLKFDGSDDYCTKLTTEYWKSYTKGTMYAIIKMSARPANDSTFSIFAVGDTRAGACGILGIQVRTSSTWSQNTRLDVVHAIGTGAGTVTIIYGDTNLLADTWYHLCVTSNGSTYKLYVNGINQTLASFTGTNSGQWLSTGNFSSTSPTDIGTAMYQNSRAGGYFNGVIDMVKFYNRDLTPSEISQLYSQPNIGIQSPTYYTPS